LIVEEAMKNLKSIWWMRTLVCLILVPLIGSAMHAGQVEPERFYFGIEIDGVLCGYSEIGLTPMVEESKTLILLEQTTFAMLSALGSQFNSHVRLTYHIDPVTGRFTYHDSYISQGPAELSSVLRIEGDTARYLSTPAEPERSVPLPPEAILENTLWFPHLVQDFVERNLEQATYDIFEVREAEVQKSTYTKAGIEPLPLAGADFNAVILDRLNHTTGLKTRMWLDTATGYLLKTAAAGNRVSYRADPSVVNRIKMVNLDDTLCARVGVFIADVQAITYMKVRATLEPTGLWVTPEGLNVPGQQFTGTISNNLIEGVFEIEHTRYDGAAAPAFPVDFGHDQTLGRYLMPEAFIESDDPVLILQALEITAGSKDSWEAACRLSRWVAQNIGYAIPGGGTARKTYDLKAGECGAHAMLLAAFCRAVGIPARVVWGCMYAPSYGGVFGQHGWNEIYMGPAGWIPVDATAGEIDFVDSGHLRIGVYESPVTALNPRQMQVLAYRAGAQQMAEPRTRRQTSTGPVPANARALPPGTW
jgi:transglutaminase-like putative cysteine protease